MTDERGYLLVEMTVTLAILVIVLAVGSAFFFFCSRTYSEGGKKTIVQSNARLAANFITKEVRYADKISTSSFNTMISEEPLSSVNTGHTPLLARYSPCYKLAVHQIGEPVAAPFLVIARPLCLCNYSSCPGLLYPEYDNVPIISTVSTQFLILLPYRHYFVEE